MPDNITVTAKTGPAVTATSRVFTGVKKVEFDLEKQVLHVTDSDNRVWDYDLYGSTTVTYTVASHIATVAVSQ